MLVLMLGTFRVNSKSVILIQFCIYMLRLLGIWFQSEREPENYLQNGAGSSAPTSSGSGSDPKNLYRIF